MTGQLSPQIGRLTNLEELYTWKDRHAEFGNLTKLETKQAHNGYDIKLTKGTWTAFATAAKDGKEGKYASFADAFANYKPA